MADTPPTQSILGSAGAARGPGSTSDGRMRALVRASVAPLYHRFRGGEGMLLPINVSLAVALRHPVPQIVVEFLLSLVVLATMYEVNDLLDAKRDLENPRKDAALATTLLEHGRLVRGALVLQHVGSVAAAASLLGAWPAAMTAAVLLTNLVYSLVFKGAPVLDVLVVGVWGSTFSAVVGPPEAALAVGAMTAVSHVYQALGDRGADLRVGLRTSAATPTGAYAALGLSSALLAALLWRLVPPWLALGGLLPFAIGVTLRRAPIAWLASKLAFGVVWLVVLHGLARGR